MTISRKKIFGSVAASLLVGAIVFFLLQRSQLQWLAEKCSGRIVPLPNSCSSANVRIWFFPIFAGVFFAGAVALRALSGSFKSSLEHVVSVYTKLTSQKLASPATQLALCIGASVTILMALFGSRYGFEIVEPSNTAWLSGGDTEQAYLGSVLFRQAEWQFPLGKLDSIMGPHGSNVGFTDPVFLIALLAKIFRNVFGVTTQYLGAWVLLCYILFGIFSGLLAHRIKINVIGQVCVAILLAFFPPLIVRFGHFTLNAMWIVPASIYILLRLSDVETREQPLTRLCVSFGLLSLISIFTAWIHPYLVVISFVFLFTHFLYILLTQRRHILLFSGLNILCVGTVIFSWYAIGYIGSGIPSADSESPVYFTANLNTFFNPLEYSSFFKTQALATNGQSEGFGYVGAGIFLFILIHLKEIFSKAIHKNLWNEYRYVCIPAFIGLILAIGTNFSFYALKVYFYLPIYSSLLSPFRSTGRFIWIPSYVLIRADARS